MAKTYDTYKDSGIAWIGKIPSKWKVCRIKNSASLYTGNSIKDEEKDYYTDYKNARPYIATKDIDATYLSANYENDLYIKTGDSKFRVAPKNSSLVCIEGGSAGKKKAFLEQEVSFVNKLCCFAPNKTIVGKYLFHFLCSPNFEDIFSSKITGLIGGVNIPSLKDINCVLPSIEEQQTIATFLDKKCSEIDSLISLQEEMISEFQAYKQSVITEAVTKGLDPKVKMKDSGVEWIGEIPEGWNTQKLRTLGWTQNGISQSGDYFAEGFPYPFVSYPDVYKNYSVPYPVGRANSTEEDRKRFSLIEGDVLFTRTSETIEEIGFASTCLDTIPDAVYSGFLIRFRPSTDKLYKGYSQYYFRSQIHRAYFVKEMNLVTRASLNQDLLKNLVVLLPSIDEQKYIANYLNTKSQQIDTLIAIKQEKIQELKDYKKSVIYEYVTGKKKV